MLLKPISNLTAMFASVPKLSRALSLVVFACAFAAAIIIPSDRARAQEQTIDWANAGVANAAAITSGTTVTGSDGTTATVTWNVVTKGGGSFVPASGADFVTYFSGTVGGNASPLLMSFDNSSYDPRDKVTVTITFSRALRSVRFALGDIDSGNWRDAVEVAYSPDNSGTFTNAATNTAFWTAGSAVSRTNDGTVNGWRGVAGSATAATDGNIDFDFGSTAVRQIRIVYFSYSGSGDPGGQIASVSDIAFANTADLSLTKQLVGSAPANAGSATWRLTVTNASSSETTANSIVVRDNLPNEFSFTSASGTGTFDSNTGNWSVGTLAPGASASIDLTGTIFANGGTVITNQAEIISSSVLDPDSTPNNSVSSEDDYAVSSFTVQTSRTPGVPPTLFCPVGTTIFDWDTKAWTAGSLNNSYSVTGLGNVAFNISGSGAWVNDPSFGGQSPALANANNGGFAGSQLSLHQYLDFATISETMSTTISLQTAVPGLQFTVFDVDFAANDFADKLTVTGSFEGTTVLPTLTNGAVNYVIGNTAIGDGGSNGTSGDGNVVVTFSQPVDTIIISYGNHSTAPADPDGQAIAIFDITFCNPDTTVSASKVSTVISDPISGTDNPKAIPGAILEYCIILTNSGSATAENVVASDVLPADLTFVAGSITSGADCDNASTAEDDDAAGADESDPNGASFASGTVQGTATSLGPNDTFAFKFQATVD